MGAGIPAPESVSRSTLKALSALDEGLSPQEVIDVLLERGLGGRDYGPGLEDEDDEMMDMEYEDPMEYEEPLGMEEPMEMEYEEEPDMEYEEEPWEYEDEPWEEEEWEEPMEYEYESKGKRRKKRKSHKPKEKYHDNPGMGY